MKCNCKIILLLTSVLLSLVWSSFTKLNVNYQTECLGLENDGYITINIWDTRKGNRYKLKQARKDAVHAILYSGIAGGKGCITQPPMLNKAEEIRQFKTIEGQFFACRGKWTMFTSSSTLASTIPAKLGVRNWKVYQISVSKNELRKYLEEQKIINSLNDEF